MVRLALCALAALLVAAVTATTGYKEGTEYVYAYKGQIYSGYPRIKDQYSGYAFHADLIIQPHGEYAIFKVDNVRKAQFNGEFEDVTHHAHNYEELPETASILTAPFKVYRKNGIVTHFEVQKGEPPFAVNLKRGVVSLFNLNLDETNGVPSTEDNELRGPNPDNHHYKIYEKGVPGDCETTYIVEHHPFGHKHNVVLNVTKVKDYHKCRSEPNQVYGTFHGYPCGEAVHEQPHTLHGTAHSYYNIRGYRHDYIIEKIHSHGEVAYTPYPLEGQTVTNRVNRFLKLVEERPVSAALELSADTDSYDSLEFDFGFQHDFHDPVDLKKAHYYYHLTGYKTPTEKIRADFEELVKMYHDESYTESFKAQNMPNKFAELLRHLGSVDYNQIEQLYTEIADISQSGPTPEKKKYRNLFIDALVNLGTNPAFEFLKHLFEIKQLNGQETVYFFTQLPAHIKEVSETILDELTEMCEATVALDVKTVGKACVYALSNIVYDHCVARYHPEEMPDAGKKTCRPEDAVKYFDFVIKKFEEATTEKEKMVFLDAAGNIGLREILPHVRPYIDGSKKVNRFFRLQTLWSIKHVGHRFPDKVRDLLVPLLFNQTEHHEFRIASFIILSMYNPGLYTAEITARKLKYDKDDQLRSYVYSHFKHLANSTHICDRKRAKQAKYALRILDDVHHEFEQYDYTYSKDHYVGGYDGDYDFGGSSRFAYFASDTGYVPRSVYVGLSDYIGGKSLHSLSFGMNQIGLDRFFDKFFGPGGSFGKRSLFDIFKKRGKRDTGVEKELNEIKAKVDLPTIKPEPIHGEFFVKYMGNTVSSIYFDDETFADFFKEGRFPIPNLPAYLQKIPEFYYQRFIMSVDKMYVFPTECGIPVIFDYKQPFHYYHHNKESSFKVEPGFFAEEREGKWPDHVKLETDSHIAMDKHLIAYSGVVIPFDQVMFGAGISRRSTVSLPLKMKFDLDVKEKKLNFKWKPVAPHNIYDFDYEPFTFVDHYDNDKYFVEEDGYKPVKRACQKDYRREFMEDAMGFGLDVQAKYENDYNHKGDWLKFLHEHDYREVFYYLYANPHFEPYHIHVNFVQPEQAKTTEMSGSIKYISHEGDYTQTEFGNNGFVDYKAEAQVNERKPFYTCELVGELELKGEKQRKVHTSFSWTRDLKRSYHKVNFFYDRTPFSSTEKDHFKICRTSYLKYPNYDLTKIVTLDTSAVNQKVESELKLHFGKDCTTDSKIHLKADADVTEQQKALEAHKEDPDTPEHHNPYAHHYQECLKERQKGINYGHHCMQYFETVTTLHLYNYRIHYENLHADFLNFTNKVGHFFKAALYPYSEHNEIDVHNPDNEVHFHINGSVHLPVVDVRVEKPRSISHYTNVFIPNYKGLSSFPHYEQIHIKNSFSELQCILEGDHVTTFDQYEYELPEIDCYKVVAKDCSKKEFFTVLGSKVNHPRYHKAVKVFLGKHKVEVLPVSEDSDLVVRVDGHRVPVTATEPYLHYETDDKTHGPDFYVTFRDFFYALHSEKYGLIVSYDGHVIGTEVSPYYRAKLCGLCGNYNGQKYDGYDDENRCYYETDKDFAYAYAIPSETCQVPKVEKKCDH